MTLLMLDSFDHYADTEFVKKWTHRLAGVITPTLPRSGLQSFDFSANTGPTFFLTSAEEHATIVVGFAWKSTDYFAGEQTLMDFRSDLAVTAHVALTMTPVGKLAVRRGTNAGTKLIDEVGASLVIGVWHYIEMKATLHDSTGAVEVRVDGVAVMSASGIDTKNAGTKTVFDSIVFGISGLANFGLMDDFYFCNGAGGVHDNFLGDLSIQTIYPSGAGNTTGMTPSAGANYTTVDEATGNTSDYVSSLVITTKDTYAFGNISTPRTIKAVQLVQYATKLDGSRLLVPVIRSAGTDYDSTGQPARGDWFIHRTLHPTDPATGVAWTDTNVNAAEFGVKVG